MFMPFATASQPFRRVTNNRLSVVCHVLSRKRSGWHENRFHRGIWSPMLPSTLIDYFPFCLSLSVPRVFTLVQTDKFLTRLSVCFHNDGWPFNSFSFSRVDLFDNLGCSHYVALCYLVFPYPFSFSLCFPKNLPNDRYDTNLFKLKNFSLSACLGSLRD